jgi:aryl-alcohol dehydrogenase-like predicted oxidoreductase
MMSPRLGLGLAALGRPGYMTLHHALDLAGETAPDQMATRAHAVLDASFDAGVRYFDVARSYGRAEEFIAAWIADRRIGASDIVIASKWGYTYTANWQREADVHEVKDHSVETLDRQLNESRRILGAHLAVYQIHSVTPESPALNDRVLLDRLARLRARGLRIGLTVSGPEQAQVINRALQVRRDGQRLFDSVQATWNILERSAEAALADAHCEGVTVILKETLANGRLTERSQDTAFAAPLALARAAARRRGVRIEDMALAAAFSRPWADIVLMGAATVNQVRSNIASCALEWPVILENELNDLTVPSPAYWRTRSSFAWS